MNVAYPRCSQLRFLLPHIRCWCSSHYVLSINASTIHNTTQHMHCIQTFSSTVCMLTHLLTHSHTCQGGRVGAQHDSVSFPHIASTVDYACVRYVMCVLMLSCTIAFAAAAPLLFRRHFLIFSWKRVSNRYASILQARNVSEKFFYIVVDLKGKQTFWNLFHSNTALFIPSIPLVIWKQIQDTFSITNEDWTRICV